MYKYIRILFKTMLKIILIPFLIVIILCFAIIGVVAHETFEEYKQSLTTFIKTLKGEENEKL